MSDLDTYLAQEYAGMMEIRAEKAEEERDALAQRCRELERFMSEPLKKLDQERDTLRAEAEGLRQQASRYERLRRLNPRQFAELHQRNLAGERFDDLLGGGAE